MQPAFTALVQRVTDELQQVAVALQQAAEEASTVELDQTSVGRLSRMDAIQQQAMAQERQERIRMRQRQLLAAQDRLAHGAYGRCCECDEDIDQDRLQQDPAVVFCMTCQMQRDQPDRLR
ncbi:MAG: molecular chaperone DnaK [Betaproteobacteria bacterium HGW-Betaproteobacteria-16]|nr:MAG: molecular chaperone DnaK [Betaproteobacteria bacterium HGW-Betaproteobacteria-16]